MNRNRAKSLRVAFTVILVGIVCAFVLFTSLASACPFVNTMTMLLGLGCGLVPSVAGLFLPIQNRNPAVMFAYFSALAFFFIGGIIFALSNAWAGNTLGAAPRAAETGFILRSYISAFLLATVAVEAVRYVFALKAAAKKSRSPEN